MVIQKYHKCPQCRKEEVTRIVEPTGKKYKTIKQALKTMDDEYAYRYSCGCLISRQAVEG